MSQASFFLLSLYFFPAQYSGLKIPTLMLLASVYFIFSPHKLHISKIFVFCFIYLLSLQTINSFYKEVPLYDFFYAALPIFAILSQSLAKKLIFENLKGTVQVIKIIIAIQFILFFLQIIDIGKIFPIFNDIFYFYYSLGDAESHFETRRYRPFGILIYAPTAGIIMYLLLRTLYVIEQKNIYLIILFLALLITGWRLGLIIFIFFEVFYSTIYRSKGFGARVGLIALVPIILMVLLNIDHNIHQIMVLDVLNNLNYNYIVQDFSFTNRLEAVEYWLANYTKYIFGGFTSDQIDLYGDAFDSEFILRSMQFGMFGLLVFWLGYLSPLFKQKIYLKPDGQFLLFFLMATSITVTTATNIFVIPYLALYTFATLRAHLVIPEKAQENSART